MPTWQVPDTRCLDLTVPYVPCLMSCIDRGSSPWTSSTCLFRAGVQVAIGFCRHCNSQHGRQKEATKSRRDPCDGRIGSGDVRKVTLPGCSLNRRSLGYAWCASIGPGVDHPLMASSTTPPPLPLSAALRQRHFSILAPGTQSWALILASIFISASGLGLHDETRIASQHGYVLDVILFVYCTALLSYANKHEMDVCLLLHRPTTFSHSKWLFTILGPSQVFALAHVDCCPNIRTAVTDNT